MLYLVIGLSLIVGIKLYISGATNQYSPLIPESIMIVTGSNTGIGYECAQEFANLGALKVILACRDTTRGNDAVKKIKL